MDFFRILFCVAGFIVRLGTCDICGSYCPSPSLTVSPSQPSYDNGQKITMICSPPNNTDVDGIRFFKNHTEMQSDTKKETMNYYRMITSKEENEGVYRCGYLVRSNGEGKLSYGSNEINIQIADDRDTAPSWIYYIVGGLVFFAVSLLSCLVYKRTEKRKSPSSVPENHITHHNPGNGVFREPKNNVPLLPLVQYQMNNTLYSICDDPTQANEQFLSTEAKTRMITDAKDLVTESFKTPSPPTIYFQVEEKDHIYSEIEAEMYPKRNNQHQTTESEYSLLSVPTVSIYSAAQDPSPLPSAHTSSLLKQPSY
ncbi:uncharacterized protein [Eleutherodactylus coqui]|uniref:uncharacterized protein n=1 Tax=Eleutherodactylus coqui TaxID=57060 RepID=UPI003461C22D